MTTGKKPSGYWGPPSKEQTEAWEREQRERASFADWLLKLQRRRAERVYWHQSIREEVEARRMFSGPPDHGRVGVPIRISAGMVIVLAALFCVIALAVLSNFS